jgi:equilibrative nucleoside transporter 1/2/3
MTEFIGGKMSKTHSKQDGSVQEFEVMVRRDGSTAALGGSACAAAEQTSAPVDRHYVVYIIFLLHGVGTLMPWNMFINANDYFVEYKLAPGSSSGGEEEASLNTTYVAAGSTKTVYQDYFLNVLGFVAQIPNVLLNAFNIFCQIKGGNPLRRIVWSIMIIVLMFIATVILAMIDSSAWPAAFFWITMVTVVIINMANGIYQNSIYGTAACLPMKYTNAVVIGSNISGTFTSIINIITMAGTPDYRTSAIYYFIAAIFVLLVAFDALFLLELLPFFRHYHFKATQDTSKESSAEVESKNTRPPYWAIFKQCWVHDLCIWFVFFVTLTCFPALQASIKRSSPNFFISEKYFGAITCFLFFNVFAVIGNVVSSFIQKPGPRWVWIPVALRVLFIPFFVFCNVKPDTRTVPVLIGNDYVYCLGSILLAFTSGYYSSLSMMYAPRNVVIHHQPVAGMMAAFFLVLGIFCGIVFATPVTLFIQHAGWTAAVPATNVTMTTMSF